MQMTYCKAGETPGYENVEVFDLDTGAKVENVFEVDTAAGWLERYVTKDGKIQALGDRAMAERITGRFDIRQFG